MLKQKILQANELARVQRASVAEIRKTLAQFKAVAIKRALAGNTSIITQKEIDRLVRYMAATLTAAAKLGKRRVQIQAKIIKASVLDDAFDDVLYPQYFGQALQVVTGYTQRVNSTLEAFTRGLVQQNLPTSTMVKLLGEEFIRLGVDPANAYTLENIARTQAQVTYNAAKYKEEQEDYIQEILWGYTYRTIGDNRVREEHAKLEGVTLPKDDPFWQKFYPPNGWSCRCTVIAVFEKQRIKRPPTGITIDPTFAGTPAQLLGLR
jgi:SPP1 gp7 family putative phage head morphogenesis protein